MNRLDIIITMPQVCVLGEGEGQPHHHGGPGDLHLRRQVHLPQEGEGESLDTKGDMRVFAPCMGWCVVLTPILATFPDTPAHSYHAHS